MLFFRYGGLSCRRRGSSSSSKGRNIEKLRDLHHAQRSFRRPLGALPPFLEDGGIVRGSLHRPVWQRGGHRPARGGGSQDRGSRPPSVRGTLPSLRLDVPATDPAPRHRPAAGEKDAHRGTRGNPPDRRRGDPFRHPPRRGAGDVPGRRGEAVRRREGRFLVHRGGLSSGSRDHRPRGASVPPSPPGGRGSPPSPRAPPPPPGSLGGAGGGGDRLAPRLRRGGRAFFRAGN